MYRLFVFESVKSVLSVTKHGFEGCSRKFNYIYQKGYRHSEFTWKGEMTEGDMEQHFQNLLFFSK